MCAAHDGVRRDERVRRGSLSADAQGRRGPRHPADDQLAARAPRRRFADGRRVRLEPTPARPQPISRPSSSSDARRRRRAAPSLRRSDPRRRRASSRRTSFSIAPTSSTTIRTPSPYTPPGSSTPGTDDPSRGRASRASGETGSPGHDRLEPAAARSCASMSAIWCGIGRQRDPRDQGDRRRGGRHVAHRNGVCSSPRPCSIRAPTSMLGSSNVEGADLGCSPLRVWSYTCARAPEKPT